MTAILLFAFFFFLTSLVISFRKAHFLKDFTTLIKGKVIEVDSTDDGVFLIIEYIVEQNNAKLLEQELDNNVKVEETKATYRHKFSPVKLPEKKLEILITRYLEANFYLLGKKENDKLVAVTPYANVKVVKWIYLLGLLAVGYNLFT